MAPWYQPWYQSERNSHNHLAAAVAEGDRLNDLRYRLAEPGANPAKHASAYGDAPGVLSKTFAPVDELAVEAMAAEQAA